MPEYRVAIVGGAGTWGRHYLRAYAEHPDCHIVALVDRATDRARHFADHYGVDTPILSSVEELFQREVPDIVSAVLPVDHTHKIVTACAEAGVRVVSCEKPIAARLSDADAMIEACRRHGTALGCGTAYWEVPFLTETAAWIQAGHIGELTAASIPGGLPREVSGAGCVQLTMMRLLTAMEVEWVEGWVMEPVEGWKVPDGADPAEVDCPAYGRLGLSGGIVCDIPPPRPESDMPCRVWIEGQEGQVWASPPQPVLIKGKAPASTPVKPAMFDTPQTSGGTFRPVVERLLRAFDRGDTEVPCSGHDYRQALEIAIALKLSARQDHRRVHLPLEDRSLRIYPHPYRLKGGDEAGWESIGYKGPPSPGKKPKRQ